MNPSDVLNFIDYFELNNTISGPHELSVLSLNNKLIFLFGDEHIPTESQCLNPFSQPISLFLDTFFRSSPVCIDLFLEADIFSNTPLYQHGNNYNTKSKESTTALSPLSAVIAKYSECLGGNKQSCNQFGNVRFHNINFRTFPESAYNLVYVPQFFISNAIQKGDLLAIGSFLSKISSYRSILISLIDGNLKQVSQLFLSLYDSFFDSSDNFQYRNYYAYNNLSRYSGYDRVGKQYKQLDNKEGLKSEIIAKYDDMINANYRDINFLTQLIYNNANDLDQLGDIIDTDRLFTIIANIIVNIGSSIMDSYAMPRIIKTIYKYSDSRVLIVYAGSYHTNNYFQILNNLYNVDIIADIKSQNQTCINIHSSDMTAITRNLLKVFSSPSQCQIKRKI